MQERPDDPAATSPIKSGGPNGAHAYLLVVENGSSSVFPLPHSGFVLIGRAPEAELHLEHTSVSRKHARIMVDRGAARVVDLESQNGTRVNGEPVEGARPLASGDVVSIGEVVLVVVHVEGETLSRAVLPEADWRRRLAEEIDRALTYRRPLTVTALVGVRPDERAPARTALFAAVRRIDVIGEGADGQLLIMQPEISGEASPAASAHLLAAIAPAAPDARVGFACCPADACDVETIVFAARAAARAVDKGGVAGPAQAARRIDLGDRAVILAHPATLRVFDLLRRLAAVNLPVLISGETGVGKENAAFALHHWSSRGGPFLALNCAAIPEGLVESELFGHERGAFTGASAAKVGLLEAAAGGTLFLDEISELPAGAQAKLLRVLENKRFTRLGDVKERATDARLVAATNRALAQEVEAGRFRRDLYFRLGGATVILPPLRERRCEIPLIARELLARACARGGRAPLGIAPDAMQVLLTHDWPGNARELRNVMDYVAAVVEGASVGPEDLPGRMADAHARPAAPEPAAGPRHLTRLSDEVRALERLRMQEALAAAGGVKAKAAQLIGMPIRTFNWKLRHYAIDRSDP